MDLRLPVTAETRLLLSTGPARTAGGHTRRGGAADEEEDQFAKPPRDDRRHARVVTDEDGECRPRPKAERRKKKMSRLRRSWRW